jgi:hypothetical protein
MNSVNGTCTECRSPIPVVYDKHWVSSRANEFARCHAKHVETCFNTFAHSVAAIEFTRWKSKEYRNDRNDRHQ